MKSADESISECKNLAFYGLFADIFDESLFLDIFC